MGSLLLAGGMDFDVVHTDFQVADTQFVVVRTLVAVDDIPHHREVEASSPRTVGNPLALPGDAQALF